MRCFDRNRYDLTGHYYIRGTEKSVSGTSSVLIEDSAGMPFKTIEIVGKTIQDGAPTLNAPIQIQNSNDSGITLSLNGRTISIPTSIDVNGESVPLTFSEHDKLTVDGLNGKVTYTQGSAMYSYTGEETGTSKLSIVSGKGNNYRSFYSSLFGKGDLRCLYNKCYNSHFEKGEWNPLSLPGTYVARNTDIIFRTDGVQTLDEFKAFLAEQYANGTPVIFVSQRETPIEHDITDTSLGKELLSLLVPKGEDATLEVKCDIGVSSINVIYYSETKEDKVALTVRYLNLSGEEIREPRTYYVRRGSEFEIIPPHIDGYTIGTIIKGVAHSEIIIRLFYKEV